MAFLQEQSSNTKSTSTRTNTNSTSFRVATSLLWWNVQRNRKQYSIRQSQCVSTSQPSTRQPTKWWQLFWRDGKPPAFGNPNTPQLHIHCAALADQDVTVAVRNMVTPSQTLDIDTDSLTTIFGDPWPDHPKQLSV